MSTSLQPYANSRANGYLGIAAALRSDVVAGELAAGSQLPSINELAQRYGTTAITVRRALRLLEEEGLIRVEHGVGTFVADWARGYDLLHLPSFSAEMAARALRSETEVLDRDADACSAVAATALGLEANAPLAVLTRLRRVEGVPIAVQRSFVPASLARVVAEYGPQSSLYDLLRSRSGRMPVAAEERIQAVAVPAEPARSLGLAANALGWLSERTTSDAEGRPLVYDEAYFPAERVHLRIHRRAQQTLLEYEVVPGATPSATGKG